MTRDSDDAVSIGRRNAGLAYVNYPTRCGDKGEKIGKPLTGNVITSISPIIAKSGLARNGSSILDDGSTGQACLEREVLSSIMAEQWQLYFESATRMVVLPQIMTLVSRVKTGRRGDGPKSMRG